MNHSGPAAARELNNLGAATRLAGDVASAIECFVKAVAIDPAYVDALYNLGCALASQRRYGEALEPLERAAALDPKNAPTQLALGAALRGLGRLDDSTAALRSALALDPSLHEAHAKIGRNELELGRAAEAQSAFERSIELNPENIAHRALAIGASPVRLGDSNVAALERAAVQTSLSVYDAVNIHFALGKAYGDLGDHARAFEHVLRGNRIKRQLVEYDEGATLRTLQSMPALFTPAFFEHRRGWGESSSIPVFIVGMPRSGTTLVEQILASHPLVHAAGETRALNESIAALGPNGVFGAAEIAGADANTMRSIGAAYLNRLLPQKVQALRVTDKMLENFVFVGIAHVALPGARIVQVRRDPVDTCLSCFSTLFAEGQGFTYDLMELGRYYRAYDGLTRHWHTVLPPETILEVCYEDLVDDLEGQTRRLLEFCGLPWDDACLRFYETQRPVRTASVTQVRRPIYRSSVGKWRPPDALLQPLYDALGNK